MIQKVANSGAPATLAAEALPVGPSAAVVAGSAAAGAALGTVVTFDFPLDVTTLAWGAGIGATLGAGIATWRLTVAAHHDQASTPR